MQNDLSPQIANNQLNTLKFLFKQTISYKSQQSEINTQLSI